ncbi:hypothetical protein EG327_009809 [Venturia inaequalis]|uniref:Uncharacterized protein n=1 Tax=Venturia inaequalis TaxID=5025 RepID=A0A8H3VQK2_VENIN|nr:hypothetical protein EG327_009809 [Venturia inaequalis]
MSLHITSRWVCRSSAIPKFTSTSSPELDTLLESIRSKVFLPSYLNKSQLKLVRSNKAKTQLDNDPVFATFGEEEIRLTHLDVTKDQPRKKVLLQFKDMAKESKDWANLPALLEGWHHARPNTPASIIAPLVRQASKAGQLSTIIQCLWQVEKNGLSLADPLLRFTIIQSIRINALESGWGNITKRSFKQIQTVLELMEKPGHCGSRTVSDSDPRAEPFCIGVALELAARRVQNEFGGKDEEGFVATYFKRLTSALGQQKSELSSFSIEQMALTSGQAYDGLTVDEKRAAFGRFLSRHLPAWHGLKLAKRILGNSVSAESRQVAEKFQKDIETKLNLAYKAAHEAQPVASPVTAGDGDHDAFAEWRSSRGR